MVGKKKFFVTLIFLFVGTLTQFVGAQLNMNAQIANSDPTLDIFQTYSRYNNITDNFPLKNFTVCIGEENRTIYARFVVEDKNSNFEITNGGNVTWKIVSVVNGSDVVVPSFGGSFKKATVESVLDDTQISYLENITLTDEGDKTLYKIITNITDANGGSSVDNSFFTLHDTDCIRIEENASLVTTEPFELAIDYFNLSIVVNENITGRIIVALHNESPVDSNVNTALDKYMTVDVEGVILQRTINLSLLVNYSQQEIADKGLDESSLRIYKFGSWNLQEGDVDAEDNIVNFVVNESDIANQSYRLGTYSVRGSLVLEESGELDSSSGGGSGRREEGGLTGEAVRQVEEEDGYDSEESSEGKRRELDSELGISDDLGDLFVSPKFPLFTMFGGSIVCFIFLILCIIELIIIICQRKRISYLKKGLDLKKVQGYKSKVYKKGLSNRKHSVGKKKERDILTKLEKEVGKIS